MEELTEILDVHFSDIEIEHPKLYWETINEMYVIINGMSFDEQCAKYAVSCMQNEDGTTGEHWSLADTNAAAQSVSLMFMPTINQYDWYYVLNMIRSDYFGVIGNNDSMYIALAKAWVCDKDAGDYKAFRYWRMVKGY